MRVRGIDQRSPQWIRARLGHVTSSRVPDVVAKVKDPNKESSRRSNYRDDLKLERLNGYAVEHDVTKPMQYGIDHEQDAAEAYEIQTGTFLEPGGWWLHDRICLFGASPDFLLPDGQGLVEVKVPNPRQHVKQFEDGEIYEPDYEIQMQAQMSVTGRQYVDYVSFDPRMRVKNLRLFIKRIPRNQALIQGYELEVEHFLEQVAQAVADLKALPKVIVMPKPEVAVLR